MEVLPDENPGRADRRPWFLRLAERIPGHPLVVGACAAAALVALQLGVWLLLRRLLGESVSVSEGQLRPMLFFAVVIAFTPASVAWCAALAKRDLADLEPALDLTSGEFERASSGLAEVSPKFATIAGTMFYGLTLLSMENNVGRISTVFSPERSTIDVYIVAMAGIVVAAATVPILSLLRMVARFRGLGLNHARIDIFNLAALQPFGRFGIRAALIPPVLLGVAMLVGTDVRAGAMIVSSVSGGCVSLYALLLPSIGVRRRILEEKAREDDRITRALRGDRASLAESGVAQDAAQMRQVDLLQYRAAIADLRDWPIGDSQWLRFGVYLLIPLATWTTKAVGEAMVGKLLE